MLDVLREWLGNDGKPVSREEAATRLAICINCPENRRGNWWDVHFKNPIAIAIRRHLATKHAVELELQEEDKTGMCKICGCAIRLKIWVPMNYIKDKTPPDIKDKFPSFCWIKKIL